MWKSFPPACRQNMVSRKRKHGTWGPQKGLETLLESDQLLRAENLEYDLTIAGPLDAYSADYETAIRELAHPSVQFIGNQPDPEPCYQNADVLIVPSSEPDPYPTVTLEGMAHGLAVIATDCGGLSEQVAHNKTGLLVSPNQPQAMAVAMRHLISSPNEVARMGQSGFARVQHIGTLRLQQLEFEKLLAAPSNR